MNTAYFVMEYCPGRSLDSALKEMESENEKITQDEVIQLIEPLMDALLVMHKEDILHRDIKPANIYIRDDNNQPMLLDFGAARHSLGKHTKSISVILTKGYAPIEQYQTSIEHQGPWTDIYGLAATMYKVITGQVPVESVGRFSSIDSNDGDPLIPLSKLAGNAFDASFLNALTQGLNVGNQQRPNCILDWRAIFNEDTGSQKSTPISLDIPVIPKKASEKQFGIYKHSELGSNAIKIGFSWSMFFAGFLNLFLLVGLIMRKMWLHVFLFISLLTIFFVSVAMFAKMNLMQDYMYTVLGVIYFITPPLVYGFKVNAWHVKKLLSKGYKHLGNVSSKNKYSAIEKKAHQIQCS